MVRTPQIPRQRNTRAPMTRRTTLIIAGISVGIIGISGALSSAEILIWNRTPSAPVGLYWKSDGPLTQNGWAVVSEKSKAAIWASENGFTGKDWPLIKRVRGTAGDTVCRQGLRVFINGMVVAEALETDQIGRSLPVWQGCQSLGADEAFLLNEHPRSLDGRYFGVTKSKDISGGALLLWEW
ncbi:MAG: hypothetical protein GC152_16355 [Alphaproteobacteria bacterium]|nr:hypothetical protein [Alphaproteobacteria bacterium]